MADGVILGLEASAQGAAVQGAAVKDVTSQSFRVDVIAESQRQPVLVDFWAPWCGPCKQLGPVIEKAVRAADGKVKLVKMNIDEHPQIAGQLGIKSIPAVIAFDRGQPVDGFVGALPESQIRNFIERLAGPVSGAADELIAQAEEALTQGEAEAAAEAFAAALSTDQSNLKALGGLARALLAAGDAAQAEEVLAEAPPGSEKDASIVAARAALDIAAQSAGLGGDLAALEAKARAAPDDSQAGFDLALALSAVGQRAEAADALLAIIRRDRAWNDDGARKQLLQFFEAWGPVDPITIAARRKLSAALFS